MTPQWFCFRRPCDALLFDEQWAGPAVDTSRAVLRSRRRPPATQINDARRRRKEKRSTPFYWKGSRNEHIHLGAILPIPLQYTFPRAGPPHVPKARPHWADNTPTPPSNT